MKKILIIGAVIVILIVGFVITGIGKQDQTDNKCNTLNLDDRIYDGRGYLLFDGQGPGYGPGPAPNSGDGIPDGPGWD